VLYDAFSVQATKPYRGAEVEFHSLTSILLRDGRSNSRTGFFTRKYTIIVWRIFFFLLKRGKVFPFASAGIGTSDYPVCCLVRILLTQLIFKINHSNYTGLFISPSGISELDCATTKTDTADRNISTKRDTLQVSDLPYRCSICAPLVTRQMSIL